MPVNEDGAYIVRTFVNEPDRKLELSYSPNGEVQDSKGGPTVKSPKYILRDWKFRTGFREGAHFQSSTVDEIVLLPAEMADLCKSVIDHLRLDEEARKNPTQ